MPLTPTRNPAPGGGITLPATGADPLPPAVGTSVDKVVVLDVASCWGAVTVTVWGIAVMVTVGDETLNRLRLVSWARGLVGGSRADAPCRPGR